MALGDGGNDLSMLEAAGLPVAMGNAVECLKKAAKITAPDARMDGAAWVIEKYALRVASL